MLRGLGTDITLENFKFSEDTDDNEISEATDDVTKSHASRCYAKLLYAVVFYHACVLERRKYGGIGWNIPYEWMASDVKTAVLQLQLYLPKEMEQNESITYENYI